MTGLKTENKISNAARPGGESKIVPAWHFSVDALEARRLLSGNWSWQDQQIGLDQASQNYPSITGTGETVAIIDAGVDYNHPALGGGYGNKVIDSWNFDTNSRDTFPYDNAHGTGTAGAIAGDPHYVDGQLYQGVAPGVKLVSLRSSGTYNTLQAFNWIIAHKAQYNIVAVNFLNDTGADIGSLMPALRTLNNEGVFMAGAAGNFGPSPAYGFPEDIIHTVGSVNGANQISSFTPRGSGLDMVAPGENVQVTWYWNGNHGDLPSNGTSWTAPQVTGAAALVKQINPGFSSAQVYQILRDSANWIYDSYSSMSYPMLNVNSAIALAYQRSGQATGVQPPAVTVTRHSAAAPAAAAAPAPAPAPAPTPAPAPVQVATPVPTTPTAAIKENSPAKITIPVKTQITPNAPAATTTTVKKTVAAAKTKAAAHVAQPAKATSSQASPFSGTPFSTNAAILAANYDDGGEGIGYHTAAPVVNSGDGYRVGGIATTWSAVRGTEVVTATKAGAWMSYTLDVGRAGTYDFNALVAAKAAGGKFHVVIDGKSVTGGIAVTKTGSADTYATDTAHGIKLAAGRHVVRVVLDNASSAGTVGTFESFSVTPVASATAATKRKK